MRMQEGNSDSDDFEDDESFVQRVSVKDEGDSMYDYEQEDSVQVISASDATSLQRGDDATETS